MGPTENVFGVGPYIFFVRTTNRSQNASPTWIRLTRTEITVVDFSVTELGLEEQILAVVVDKEHPELEKQRSDLIRIQNESTIHLKQLEDKLLTRLASSSQAQVRLE